MSAIAPTPWDALLQRRSPPSPFDRSPAEPAISGTSKTAQIRALLRVGPMSASDICMELDLRSTGLVGALLKHDIAVGRVRSVDGLYELCSEFEQDLIKRIREARALLLSHGYKVEKQ